MDVMVLGSGDAFGSGGRFYACYRLSQGDNHILVDCGPSSLIAMRKFGVDPRDITAICLTHLHGDHFGGVPFFLLDAAYVSRRTAPLTIFGPAGTEARLNDTYALLYPGIAEKTREFPLHFVEIQAGETFDVAGFQMTPFPANHDCGAPPFLLRFSADGQVVTFSGDTAWTPAICDAARDADLFVCESCQYDQSLTGHMDYKTLVANWEAIGAKKILLTHMNPPMLAMTHAVDRSRFLVAEDGLRVTIGAS